MKSSLFSAFTVCSLCACGPLAFFDRLALLLKAQEMQTVDSRGRLSPSTHGVWHCATRMAGLRPPPRQRARPVGPSWARLCITGLISWQVS